MLHLPRRLFLLLAFALLLGGCTQYEKEADPLKLGIPDWLGYQPLVWAEKKYLEPSIVSSYEMPSNPESLRLFNNGLLDVTCVTLDDAVRLAQYNNDLVVIAVLDISHGGDSVLAQPSITSIRDLKGKRIGYEKEGAGSYMFSRLLELAGLTVNDVIPVYLNFYDHKSALEEEKVDVIITFEPIANQLLELGANKIFDSSMIPDEIVDILVTRESVIHERPQEIRRLLDAWYRAAGDVHHRHDPAAQQYLQAYLDIDNGTLQNGLKNIRFLDTEQARAFLVSEKFSDILKHVNTNMLGTGEIKHVVGTDSLVKREYLELLY